MCRRGSVPGKVRVVLCSTVLFSRVGFFVAARLWGAHSGHRPPYFSFPGWLLPLNPAAMAQSWAEGGWDLSRTIQ